MGKLFKNLKPYWKSVLMIVVLLVVQAFCDLSLPQYTSDIIDTGIQNSGVEHILPEKITAEEFQNAQLFMTADEQKTWQDAYNGDGDILDRNDFSKKDLEQLDSDLIVPILLNYQMSMMSEDGFREMLMQQQQGNPQAAEQLKTMSIGRRRQQNHCHLRGRSSALCSDAGGWTVHRRNPLRDAESA